MSELSYEECLCVLGYENPRMSHRKYREEYPGLRDAIIEAIRRELNSDGFFPRRGYAPPLADQIYVEKRGARFIVVNCERGSPHREEFTDIETAVMRLIELAELRLGCAIMD